MSNQGPQVAPSAGADERYRLLFDRNPQPMWVYDVQTLRFLAVNDAAVEHYGYDREEFLAMTIRDIRPYEERRQLELMLARVRAHGGSLETRHVKKDGTVIDVEVLADELMFAGHRGRLVVATDVTERKRTSAELEQRAAKQEVVARLGGLALEGIEIGELVEEAVAAVTQTLGVELAELLEQAEDRDSFILRSGVGWQEGLVRRQHEPGGSRYYAAFTWGSLGHVLVEDFATEERFEPTRRLVDHDVASAVSVLVGRPRRPFGLLGVFSRTPGRFDSDDVNFLKAVANVLAEAMERSHAEEQIRHQALHDALTGLPNRTLLLERLEHWLDRSRRAGGCGAVLFVDLDHFKLINDGLGHDVGDQLLLEVARRLASALRASDTVARVGGDEFIVFCEDIVNEMAAVELVERINATLRAPFWLKGRERHITASVGIAIASAGDTPDVLLRNADAAMYRAKERGRDRFELFDEGMRDRSLRWLETERELRQALERGELHNLYQPIVSAQGIIGFEALVRWHHPERGVVSPADFIPVAEESGLIVPLGRHVLENACREAAGWPKGDAEHPPTVSVNLSPRQVSDPGLSSTVADILATTGLEPGRLCLEITETVLLQDTEVALQTLRELRELGVSIVLDDFGTGFSSLSYVKRFPIDMLKIDRSFVEGLARDPEDCAIVSAVISMGRALGVDVVAEGVETYEQAAQLKSLGCALAQGFLFARPLDPSAATDLIRRGLWSAGVKCPHHTG
ncbi:MAG TPA: EAL domain-containing protein [Solirubrobacteraceae bacterium]|nr:EAL domain-containing protein [Solirubrobacteraceae bacterium]